MEYTTYWSIVDTPSHAIKSNTIALIIFIVGALLWFLAKKYKKDKGDEDKKIILIGTAAIAVIGFFMFVILTFIYKDNTQQKLTEMLNSNKVSKVEGPISNFERSYRNHKGGRETTESFMVDSIKFSYSDAALAKFSAFGQTYNNILLNGQFVRITYNYDSASRTSTWYKILKIEIRNAK